MSLKPIALYRRRWTLVFSLPFAAFMAIVALYSLYFAFAGGDRLVVLIAGGSAFVSICVGGTIGRSALEALLDKAPAVVIDEHGLEDVKSGDGVIPWRDIAEVRFDSGRDQILVRLGASPPGGSQPTNGAMTRLFTGADITIPLDGLSYHPIKLQRGIAGWLRQARAEIAAVARASRPSDPGFL
ncbi:hypothetical protein ACQQ2N_07090 [Dokdonella sp. MW10]|uniref:hypothetical protein n=1 Tax=Dokdonella sp. MW10 TaxID=2992926 RepID=UPI003F7DF12D